MHLSGKLLMKFGILLFCLSFYASHLLSQYSTKQPERILPEGIKKQLIDSLIKQVSEGYVFEDKAAEIANGLKVFRQTKAFAKINDFGEFADILNLELRRLSNDKHLSILYSYDTIPVPQPKEAPIPEFIKQFAINNNYGFNKLEILPGNIGYMNILGFFPYEQTQNIAIGAFNFIENTSALILDLRQNSGGETNIVNFIISYFFGPEPVSLGTTKYRKDNQIEQVWTAYYVPGKRYLNKPLYVLTSHQTFSGGEATAFLLQKRLKATVIGEQTGGGANMCDVTRLNDHMVLSLPIASAYPPTTTTWEGAGVIPDIKVSADKALDVAQAAALKRVKELN